MRPVKRGQTSAHLLPSTPAGGVQCTSTSTCTLRLHDLLVLSVHGVRGSICSTVCACCLRSRFPCSRFICPRSSAQAWPHGHPWKRGRPSCSCTRLTVFDRVQFPNFWERCVPQGLAVSALVRFSPARIVSSFLCFVRHQGDWERGSLGLLAGIASKGRGEERGGVG